MRTRHMTVAEFEFLRDVQIRPRWGWSATFSLQREARSVAEHTTRTRAGGVADRVH